MKKSKVDEYLKKRVIITLFDNDIVEGILKKADSEEFKHNPNLYFSKGCYACFYDNYTDLHDRNFLFRSSHIKKIEEIR